MNTAIITGASRGIGFAAAHYFQQQHYRVINISRHPCDLKGVDNITADFTAFDKEAVQGQLRSLLDQTSTISLIHNASWYGSDSIETMSQHDLESSLNVSVIVPSQLNQLCLPFMDKGSNILYVGSTLSEQAVKNAASYVIAKHAVVGLMHATCQDLDNRFIHTACVCPGFTNTEMLREHIGRSSELETQITSQVSFRRLIDPVEIAKTLWFAANNPVVNGSVLHVNLGQILS